MSEEKDMFDILEERGKEVGGKELPKTFEILSKRDEEAKKEAEKSGFDLFNTLKDRSDFSKYRPRHVDNVELKKLDYIEVEKEGEDYYILRNPKMGAYYKVDEKGLFLWNLMDGKHTVRDLLVAYFTKYNAFAYDKIVRLIFELKKKLLLTEKHVDIYEKLSAFAFARKWIFKMQKLLGQFLHKDLFAKDIDKPITLLYNVFFKHFFKYQLQFVYLFIALAGFLLFISHFMYGNFALFEIANSYGLGVLILLILSFPIFIIHEAAHAFFCKHYGRKVGRSGLMLYFGLPAAFVDTTDIWMASRKARVLVSFAGPYSQLILAGLASMLIFFIPEGIFASILFQFVFLNYISVFVNMNPLLELDGYYIFMDYIGIPCLRRKSLHFVGKKLLPKLAKREKFEREEKTFAIFGLLSAFWSILAVLIAINFWNEQLVGLITDISQNRGVIINIVLIFVILIIIIPLVISTVFKLLEWWRKLQEA